jgi:hypothetical protein
MVRARVGWMPRAVTHPQSPPTGTGSNLVQASLDVDVQRVCLLVAQWQSLASVLLCCGSVSCICPAVLWRPQLM